MKKTYLVLLLPIFLYMNIANALPTWHGQQRGLVLFMDWSNTKTTVDAKLLEQTFFSKKNSDLSLNKFMLENSMGKFGLSGKILGKKVSNKVWNKKRGCSLKRIVKDAVSLFKGDYKISDYDSDNNGKIDNLFIVHSGRIGSDRVGPSCTFTNYKKADHTIVFQSNGIGSIGEAVPVGFYIHEGGHKYYRLPDLYNNHKHGEYGIGMWGMMGLGAWGVNNQTSNADLFRYPAHFEPLSKIKIGWTKPIVIKHSSKLIIKPVETSGEIYALPVRRGVNYYLEYRSATSFSKKHHGHGLLIWKNFALIEADGRSDINNGNDLNRRPLPPIDENFGDDSDVFPGSLGISVYEDKKAKMTIQNIVKFDDRIELDVIYHDQSFLLRDYQELKNNNSKKECTTL